MTGNLFVLIATAGLIAISPAPAAAGEAPASVPTAPVAFPSDRAIQRLLDDYVAAKRCEGIVLATYVPGRKQVFTSGTSGRPGLSLDGNTLFEIGSITKTLTASLLADMV